VIEEIREGKTEGGGSKSERGRNVIGRNNK